MVELPRNFDPAKSFEMGFMNVHVVSNGVRNAFSTVSFDGIALQSCSSLNFAGSAFYCSHTVVFFWGAWDAWLARWLAGWLVDCFG